MSSEVVEYVRRAILLRDDADLTDGQVLKCVLSGREPAAMEVLVRRYGPMVWGVCCRVLGNTHDAEDAFQATFLVLVRKAASIHSVGNWLYGVAHQTALKARATRAMRRMRERPVDQVPEPVTVDSPRQDDLKAVLDQELSRLPDKYRSVIVLCELDGQSGKQAAQRLGVAEGTVASRLFRARSLLAKRLARRGLAISGGAWLAGLFEATASASIPARVLTKTAELLTPGKSAETVSPSVAALTEGVSRCVWAWRSTRWSWPATVYHGRRSN